MKPAHCSLFRKSERFLKNSPTLFHIDAAQSFGKEASLANAQFDFVSISSHKIYGPQGIVARCVRRSKLERRDLSWACRRWRSGSERFASRHCAGSPGSRPGKGRRAGHRGMYTTPRMRGRLKEKVPEGLIGGQLRHQRGSQLFTDACSQSKFPRNRQRSSYDGVRAKKLPFPMAPLALAAVTLRATCSSRWVWTRLAYLQQFAFPGAARSTIYRLPTLSRPCTNLLRKATERGLKGISLLLGFHQLAIASGRASCFPHFVQQKRFGQNRRLQHHLMHWIPKNLVPCLSLNP